MVREAEQGITDQITIILDTDRGTHSRDGEGLSESFETGVRVAASLGVRHLREGYEVKVETNGGPLTPSAWRHASQLAAARHCARGSTWTVRRSARRSCTPARVAVARRCSDILITPQLGPGEARAAFASC